MKLTEEGRATVQKRHLGGLDHSGRDGDALHGVCWLHRARARLHCVLRVREKRAYANGTDTSEASKLVKVRTCPPTNPKSVRTPAGRVPRDFAFAAAVTPCTRVKADLQILSLLQEHRA